MSIESLPPLHPCRILTALDALMQVKASLTASDLDTCRCALLQIQRAQRVIGMTPDVADLGHSLVQAATHLSKLVRRRI